MDIGEQIVISIENKVPDLVASLRVKKLSQKDLRCVWIIESLLLQQLRNVSVLWEQWCAENVTWSSRYWGTGPPRQSELNRALVPKGKEFIEVCKLLEFNGKSCV